MSATFAGARDGTPYCLRVGTNRDLQDADLRRAAESGLRACRLYAKYGTAGPEVQRWLRAGNADIAAGSGDPVIETPSGAISRRSPEWYGTYRMSGVEAPVFGMNRVAVYYTPGGVPLSAHRCVVGHAEACGKLFLEQSMELAARPVNADELAITPEEQLLAWAPGLTRFSAFILSDLEGEFGEEAFSRFWTSAEPVPEAFEAAFGVSAGEWMLSWVEAEIGWLDEAGPGLRPGTLLPTLLVFMALAAGASFTQARRRVT